MKKKSAFRILTAVFCIASVHAFSKEFPASGHYEKAASLSLRNLVTPYNYDLDPLIILSQNVNEKGLVVMSGQLTKPFTSSNILISIKYQNAQGEWITGWCKTLYSYNQYNEILKATFELPASVNPTYNIKVELSSDSSSASFTSVSWDKTVSHYKLNDYASANCDLDENEYTILLTPKKNGTLVTDTNGKVTGIKDRVTSSYSWNKLSNVLMNNKKDNVLFSPTSPATLFDDNGIKSVKIVNQGAITDTLASTPEFIYDEMAGHPIPYLYSYDDPVYMFAGKFSVNGFFIKFSQWPGEPNGPGYFNFKNPNILESRYFNLYNTTNKKLSDFITDQEPVVIVSSIATGLRVYKNNGSYIDLTPDSTSNYGPPYFGYTNNVARRGPGSENLIISNTSEMTLYGMGALRNDVTTSYQTKRSLQDIEKEISKFIKYTGVFGSSAAYDDNSACSTGCFTINAGAIPDNNAQDWSKAPNSYIFVPNQDNDGLYIPVKKAYKMWNSDPRMGGSPIPSGTITADVYWEDNHGLIKSGENYSLEIIGSGENAKIKVPINKSKEGNAVIAYKVNGEVFWSWHVWVTDDPTNGSTYKSFDGLKRQKSDGTVEAIPNSDWGWMDRNLGAVGSALTGDDWIRNGGLLYQWGRKDPIPPLMTKGNDSYEASGSVGRIRHKQAKNWQNNAKKIDDLIKTVTLSNATVSNNIRLSVKNPLSLIYVNKDDNSGQAYYNNNLNLQVNWFGNSATLPTSRLTELNLWSDNSKGVITAGDYNNDNSANPYRDKSAFDPCPNGWRIPSVLVSNLGNGNYIDDLRVDFSPFGIKSNIHKDVFEANKYHIIKPNDNNTPGYMTGIKIYRNLGMDFSNAGGNNMGIFPGTGILARGYHEGQYTDQHETYLWTATMAKWFDATPAVSARNFRLIPDGDQPDIPDTSLSTIKGRYQYYPLGGSATSGTNGCRCIKDPLYKVNQYDFPTEFFNDNTQYVEGINNPNTYTMVKNTAESIIQIPISKAFSAQSQLLNNPDILNPLNYNNLKVNVLWSTNTALINNISVSNPTPNSLNAISNSNINVKIAPNQAGNAVVTLHNGSITNPIYWSWHIWVTNTPIGSSTYTTDQPMAEAPNYINYTNSSQVLTTEFMDRNIGATDSFPTIPGDNLNPETVLAGSSSQIINSGGLHYQWGRKDPIPTYRPAYVSDYKDTNGVTHYYKTNAVKYYLGTVNAAGSVAYTPLTEAAYNTSYIKAYNTYSNASNANVLSTDKPAEKVAKILSYSVKNPLAFMVPSIFAPVDPSNSNYNNGSDWLATEPNLAADRWGRGGKKSPFDPCPEGWRIPDFTSSEPAAGYGVSPWYKKGVATGLAARTINDYLGTRVRVAKSVNTGFTFDYNAYSIGNYPIFTGIRGSRSVTANTTPDFNAIDAVYSGIWSASLASNYRGRPINLLFQNNNSDQTKIYSFAYHDNNDPYFGESCRCVKVKYDNEGNEQGPIPRLQVTTTSTAKATNTLAKAVIEEKVTQNKLEFFPNPVKSTLYIKGNDRGKDYYYQIYNMSGQMIKSGKFENEQTDLSSLTTGTYLVRINNSETIVKIIKE
ncbi:T9SS type A sorting domain-containing protein [Chryseobacterium sp. FH2]|uniref:T9SS type A sorting domain-containing protein n=1 Tax=Chryseobacterium sp. FH2 TaxID=1674291 RepID=UPI0013F3FEB1|nr:T9SS type A sorting domain-containing protein [Chryseobacterium sp. FH2]